MIDTLRESLIYRMIAASVNWLNHSFITKLFERMGRILESSMTASRLRTFALRKCFPDGSLFYRAWERLNRSTMGFRDKAFLVLKESRIYRILSVSRAFSLISLLLIPLIGFYAFVDELGRSVFGDFPLFGSWDEAYLLISAIFVMLNWFFAKRHRPLSYTPAGAPMLLLIAVSFYLLIMNSTFFQLGFEGFRVVVQYILWFFILNSFLDDDKKAYLVIRLMVYAGGLMGFHGILQYILKVPTPKGWTDIAEGTTATRVFSIVESPNILGSLMILFIPLCLALVLQTKRSPLDRSVFFMFLGAMSLSLVLTLSRGAWLGAAIALVIFCLAINPRWLILLGVGGSTMLLIPSVFSRIQYMLSPQYFKSSMTGGRLMRYEKGLELFSQNEWMGVGLGHFGGAVAMNNKKLIPNTFYMDNYWLKTAVEMGLMGIIAFGILIAVLVIWSIRSIKQSKSYEARLITAGGFSGLCGVLFHNLMENVFEVPYAVVYFWVIASLVFYFGLRRQDASGDGS